MQQQSKQLSAAERARWLGELSEALDAAHGVMQSLEMDPRNNIETMELYLRIEAVRLQVQALRLGRRSIVGDENDPQRPEVMPWQRAAGNAC